jgi:hypothetical protein
MDSIGEHLDLSTTSVLGVVITTAGMYLGLVVVLRV